MDDATFLMALGAWGMLGWLILGVYVLGKHAARNQPRAALATYFEAVFHPVDDLAQQEAWGIFTGGANAMLMEVLKICHRHPHSAAFEKDLQELTWEWLPPKKLGEQ